MTPTFDAAAKTVQAVAEQTRAALESLVANSSQQFSQAQEKLAAGWQEAAAESRANLDAVIKAGEVVAKGGQDAGKEAAAFAQAQVAAALEAGHAMLSVKSVQDLVDLQARFLKGNAEALYAQTVKASQLSAAVAQEAAAPLTARVTALTEKLARPIAA